MKSIRVIAGIVIGLLLVASFVVSFILPSSVEVAKNYCSKRGVQAENLELLGFRSSSGLFGTRGTVEFQVKGVNPAKKVVVELRQPMYFLPWQVVEFREEAK